MSDTPFNKQAADLIETALDLIKQVLVKHSAAVLEEMHDQIVKRNDRISELERENAALREQLAEARKDAERLENDSAGLRAGINAIEEHARRLRMVEHAAWHLLDNSEHRMNESIIVVDKESFEALSALLPEQHPSVALAAKAEQEEVK